MNCVKNYNPELNLELDKDDFVAHNIYLLLSPFLRTKPPHEPAD